MKFPNIIRNQFIIVAIEVMSGTYIINSICLDISMMNEHDYKRQFVFSTLELPSLTFHTFSCVS